MKVKMFFKIIGWLWIAVGIFWFLRPKIIIRHFKKGLNKHLRRIFIILLFLMAGIFLWATKFANSLLAKILLIFAILAIVKGLFIARSKIFEKVFNWWSQQPLWFWRLWAITFIILGFLLVQLK
jgi:hypothetical protein